MLPIKIVYINLFHFIYINHFIYLHIYSLYFWPLCRYVFWTDWGFRSYIGRLGMDGSDLLQIHNHNIVWPNGITIDYTTDKLYWTDASLDHLS